ncbi:2-keto-4-pentenoate hydratase [Sphingomonas sp. H39-1-10]|uniref:2-keto-4-pentenoate hydratase n=1 Tax=Sphingomonas TaxID=13687 RepID=UPI0008878A83|nr:MULTISPECIES: 2-keto-4-pentenoate hydratase [Sphingomonas]MDF0486556.1 2-keto-4-pentenoate hydratase [Sphingomonas pollutisoli]SDA22657.1 2-keto-4-pentenoate hydratase [Sphingomonas sp. NFR15]
MTPDNNAERIARSFTDARRAGMALPEFPGRIPESLAQAYAVQERAIALSDARIGGWKVGKISPPFDGVDRLAGPIFADHVVPATDDLAMPIFAQGFGAAEAEFLLRVGTAPDPAKTRYTIAEATALIDAVHVGIEIASSPFPGINDHGPTVTVSDFGNNNGLIVGAAIENWRDVDLDTWPVELWINDALIGSATTATMLDGPFGAARFLFELLAARGIPVEAGQWISTGAVTGVHRVVAGDRVRARFDARLAVTCAIVAR